MLAADATTINRAHRYRRMLGAAMRQVGIFAAAADHALDHHQHDLVTDHANARALAEILAASDAIDLDPSKVETNIVIFQPNAASPAQVAERALAAGVAVLAMGDVVRAVTHRDVSTEECLHAARCLVAAAEAS